MSIVVQRALKSLNLYHTTTRGHNQPKGRVILKLIARYKYIVGNMNGVTIRFEHDDGERLRNYAVRFSPEELYILENAIAKAKKHIGER